MSKRDPDQQGERPDDVRRGRDAHGRRIGDARLKTLAELSSDWYWELDDQFRFAAFAEGVDGRPLPRSAIHIGKARWENPTTNLTPEQWAAHRAILEAHLPFRDFEYSRVGLDGERRWVSISGAPIFEADGTFKGFVGVGRDISARKREEQLRELEHSVARCLAREREASKAMEEVIRIFCESEDWEMGRYWRREDALGTLGAAEYWAAPGAPIHEYLKASSELKMGPGLGLSGYVLRTGEPLWVADVTHDPRVHQKILTAEMGVHGVFLFPVTSEDEIVGVLTFSSREIRKPDALLLEAVIVIGGQVGQFLRRVRAEDDLRRFRVALDHSADMILLIDRNQMRYVDVNETVCRKLGYTREEITAMGPQDVLPVNREALERSYDHLLAEPAESGSLRSHYLCKDGSKLPFESSRHVIRSGDGFLIVAVSRDIRERLAAEDALRDSEARFRAIFERSNAGITIWDKAGRILGVNQAHADFLGYTREELMALTIDDTRPAADPQWGDNLQSLNTVAPDGYTRDRRYVRKDGSIVWGRISVAPVHDPDGRAQYFTSVCTDITEARESSDRISQMNEALETRVRERTAELEALVKELESFSYTISHDLRAPLRSMGGFAEILQKSHSDVLPPEAQRMLGRILANAHRMSDLLDGLLAFARLGRTALATKPVAMGALADEAWAEFAAELQGRRVVFTRNDMPDSLGDPVLLKQVWANLLSNALKYTRGRDPAEIALGWDPAARAYFVRDNGAGFDMRFADKLFGVFSRLHGEEEFEGTGLGLAICERIVRRHGGRIRGEGAPGRGAVFHFSV